MLYDLNMLVKLKPYGHNLRTLLSENLPQTVQNTNIKVQKFVPVGAGFLTVGLVGVVFTSFTLVSFILVLAGVGLLVTKLLVQKSLALSSGLSDNPLTEYFQAQKHAVAQTKYFKHNAKLGEKAFSQVQDLHNRYKNIMGILAKKFSPTELTFERYEKSINEVVFTVLNNLKEVTTLLTSLEVKAETSPASRELVAVHGYLEAGSKALSEMDLLTKSITNINIQEPMSEAFEESLERLRTLASQAHLYSKTDKKD